MGFSFTQQTGDGNIKTFPFSFVGPDNGFFEEAEVLVTVDGVSVPFVLSGPSQVTLLDAPADNSAVIIRRVVPTDEPYTDFQRGNNFSRDNMNRSFQRQLYLSHQIMDGFKEEGVYEKQILNMGGFSIINGADGINDNDFVTLHQARKIIEAGGSLPPAVGAPFIIVATGSSNMKGAAGSVGGVYSSYPDVKVWDYQEAVFSSSDIKNTPILMPTGEYAGEGGANNIAIAFANRVYEEQRRPVYVILVAKEAQPISQWDGIDSVLYSSVKEQVEAALVSIGSTEINAVLFHQGEMDNENADYSESLSTIISQFKAEAWWGDKSVFVAGRLKLTNAFSDASLEGLNTDADGYTCTASSSGLTPNDSNLHFDGQSLYTFGHDRYYAAFMVAYSTLPFFIQDAVGAVPRDYVDKMRDLVSLKDFGAAYDGVTDDTVAVQKLISVIGGAAATIHITGPLLISAALTFGGRTELQFSGNGKFIGTAGTELIQVQKQIVSGPHTCFENCVVRGTSPQSLRPEWFGAVKDGVTSDLSAFNKAISFLQYTGGSIHLSPGTYAVATAIIISYGRITIQGCGNNISWIKVTNANDNGIILNGAAESRLSNLMLRDFSIISSAPSSGLGLMMNFTDFAIIERMQVHDFLVGVRMQGAANSQLTKVGATYTGASNGFIGFTIYGGASGATSGSPSSILRDCYTSGMAGLTGQIGFKVYGSYMSDIQFDTCETALTNYGYYLDYSTAPSFNVDIIIRNPIIDRYFSQGILVNDLPSNGIVQIIGGYSNPDTVAAVAQNIYLASCQGAITIVGHEFMALTNAIYTTGLYITGCSGVNVSGCVFSQLDKGVHAISSAYSLISNNIFRGGNPSSFSKCIEITGGSRIMTQGNSFSGAASGVAIDATSSGCGIVGNTANILTIAARFSNLGTGPIGGTTGELGLNSGM